MEVQVTSGVPWVAGNSRCFKTLVSWVGKREVAGSDVWHKVHWSSDGWHLYALPRSLHKYCRVTCLWLGRGVCACFCSIAPSLPSHATLA